MQAWCKKNLSKKFIPKEDRPANSCDVNLLETIWIITDETTYKDPCSHQNTGRAITKVTMLRLEECDFGHTLGARTFHTSPLTKQTVRKHTGRHSGY